MLANQTTWLKTRLTDCKVLSFVIALGVDEPPPDLSTSTNFTVALGCALSLPVLFVLFEVDLFLSFCVTSSFLSEYFLFSSRFIFYKTIDEGVG